MKEGVPDTTIARMTGHASRIMKRYKHLSPSFKQQSVELVRDCACMEREAGREPRPVMQETLYGQCSRRQLAERL